jgi:hypothetical protein
MAYLTLRDVVARSQNDALIGLVDDVIYNSPEMELLPMLPKLGTSYRIGRVTGFPTAQFAQVSGGVTPSKSTFKQEIASLNFVDVQLQIAEAIIKADEGNSLEDILTGESSRAMRAAFQLLGKQMYYGTSADANGFLGLTSVIAGVTGYEIDASAGSPNAAGSNSSAWLVRLEDDGVSMAVGKNGTIELSPWAKQQTVVSGTGNSQKVQTSYVSNFSGFFGLTVASQYAAWRIKNISSAIGKANGGTTYNLNDLLGNQLVAVVPQQYRRNLRWFMTRDALYSLQASRSSVGYQPAGAVGTPGFAPTPTELAGFPITVTDSLNNPVAGSGGD